MRNLIIVIGMFLAVLMPANALAQAGEMDFASTQDRIWGQLEIDTKGGMTRFDCEQLRVLRNTVYARYGFDFQSNWVSRQFDRDERYMRVPGMDSDKVSKLLSDDEQVLVASLKAAEETNQCTEYWADFRDFAVVEGYFETGDCGCFMVWMSITVDPPTAFGEVYNNGQVLPEWLEPFTCDELSFLEAAVYARHGYAFTSDEQRSTFEGLDEYFPYEPDPRLTRESTEDFFNNIDRLNLLVIRRIARQQSCDLTSYEW